MPKYLSKEADGSIIEFDAEHIAGAFFQYTRKKCSGELYTAIPLEQQPSIYRNARNQRLLEDKSNAIHNN